MTSFSHDDVWRDAVMGATVSFTKKDLTSGYADLSPDGIDATKLASTKLILGSAPVKQSSDGSTASYYELPANATELQELIAFRDMNAQIGEIFRACYRYGIVAHSPKSRDIKKIIFYAQAELKRLETYGEN